MERRSDRNAAAVRPTSPAKGSARVRIILADDHAIVTDGLRRLLEPEYQVVAVVGDGQALLKAARELKPDVVVADITMPLLNGIDAVRALRRRQPAIRAILLTMHADRTYVAEAAAAGASGFVVKHAAADELRTALLAVLRGGCYVSPLIGGPGAMGAGRRAQDPLASAGRTLTSRQRQVLQLVAEGHTVREIAKLLCVSPKTVEFHKYRIIDVLGLDSTAQLVRYAVEHGLLGE